MLAETATYKRVIVVSCEFKGLSGVRYICSAKAATDGKVNQRAVKQTRGLPHQQQERSSPFQFKCSLLDEAEFLLSTGKVLSLDRHRSYFLSDGVSKSMADSRPKGPRLQLGHLWVSELLF